MTAATAPLSASSAAAPDDARLPARDLVELVRYFLPLEARLVQGCLVASGVPAVLADDQLVQTDFLLAPALGGVRILVPQDRLDEAQGVLDAFARGAYTLGEGEWW